MKNRITAIFFAGILSIGVLLGGVAAKADSYPSPLPDTYINTGNMADDFVAHAMSQVGYSEGNNDWNAFGGTYGSPSGAWCAFFLRWCADKANIPESIFPRSRFGRVSDMWETSDCASLTFHPVNDYSHPYIPKKGDIVIYRSLNTYYDTVTKKIYTYPTANSIECYKGKTTGSSGKTQYISHIGIVSENCQTASNNGSYVNWSTFKMIDGNWKGKVALRSECFRDITGFVSLSYPAAPSGGSSNTYTPGNNYIGSWQTLKNGSSGFAVVMLQYLLNERIGAGLNADGQFGALTAAAVKKFQLRYGLTQDGIVGKNTWKMLTNFCQSSESSGKNGTRSIQYALRWKFGINLNIDGGYGPITKNSVIKLQQYFNLSKDGIVGPNTWRAFICGSYADLG